ncbi:MAG: hypothetical protein K2X91_10675 [Thermoleophilia bacterium]|nr:hypothetical protein [Thermoleophilia bacterium]
MPVPGRADRLLRSLHWRRRVLLVQTVPPVIAIVAAKLAFEQLGWEFITVSPLHTRLAGTMSDYKESERLPTETAAAMESIYREGAYVKALHPGFDLARLADTLAHIPHTFRDDLVHETQATIPTVERLTESFLEMERLGVPPNYIARLKQEQALIVRNLMRVAYIQRIAFLPSAYTLVETILGLLIALLMFTRVDTPLTDTILLGFISFIFIYILRLLRLLDTPFRHRGAGLDDVSLFQVDAVHDVMHERLDGDARARHGAGVAGP